MTDRMYSYNKQSIKEAETVARKEQENAKEELQLQQEEAGRRKLVKKMMNETDVKPITDVLQHMEGIFLYFLKFSSVVLKLKNC